MKETVEAHHWFFFASFHSFAVHQRGNSSFLPASQSFCKLPHIPPFVAGVCLVCSRNSQAGRSMSVAQAVRSIPHTPLDSGNRLGSRTIYPIRQSSPPPRAISNRQQRRLPMLLVPAQSLLLPIRQRWSPNTPVQARLRA